MYIKKPVGSLNNVGYFKFKMSGNINYFCHKFIYECFYGIIKDGFVIHHINSVPTDYSLYNLRLTTQSQNCKFGNTGKCKIFGKRVIKSINTEADQEIVFKSMNSAAR